MLPAMEINEMLEFLEIELENNLVSATCEISGGKILITPFEFEGPGEFADSWYEFANFLKLGWLLAEPDQNGVFSLILA
jgi:hypothetical protein